MGSGIAATGAPQSAKGPPGAATSCRRSQSRLLPLFAVRYKYQSIHELTVLAQVCVAQITASLLGI